MSDITGLAPLLQVKVRSKRSVQTKWTLTTRNNIHKVINELLLENSYIPVHKC